MSKAYKCDRCRNYFDEFQSPGEYFADVRVIQLNCSEKSQSQLHDHYELCPNCSRELKRFLEVKDHG